MCSKKLGRWQRFGHASFCVALMFMVSACALFGSSGKTYSSREQAVDAFVSAERHDNESELLKVLGSDAKDIVSSGDSVADKEWRHKFLVAYNEKHGIESVSDDKSVLTVGEKAWPLPIPLVRVHGGWQWNTDSGRQEILDRRIGRNELNVIAICRAYVEAQGDYAASHSLPSGQHEYAQQFISSPGKHDGLYWPAADGQEESPLGPMIAEARAEGYESAGKNEKKPTPYYGYFYKILKEQGPHASHGARSYVSNGHMTGGFALLAFPAKYGDSGIMTFIVNSNGIVYEKNLGRDTAKAAERITSYDPDRSWSINSASK